MQLLVERGPDSPGECTGAIRPLPAPLAVTGGRGIRMCKINNKARRDVSMNKGKGKKWRREMANFSSRCFFVCVSSRG